MKVCCDYGRPFIGMSEIDKFYCNYDHCTGPIELPEDWQQWILSQIKQEGVEKYTEWYERMLVRGAICDELIEEHNKLFTEEK